MLATIVPRIAALLAQRGAQAVVAGILSGAVVGAGGVASGLIPVGAPRAAATVALLACPGSGPELTRVSSGQPLLVTARSQDGRWLQVFVGEPGIDRGWAPAAMLRLQSAGDGLPVADCVLPATEGPPVTAGPPPATGPIPTPAPGSTVQATVLPTPVPTLAPGATPTARPKPTATPKSTPIPTPVVTPSPTPPITPAPDLTPPSITGVSITGAYWDGTIDYYIYNVGSGCGSSSATISITVTDAGGSGLNTSSVTLHWKDPFGTQHNVQMGNPSTNLFRSTITNPGSSWPDSNLEYWVTASDHAGNVATTSHPPDNSHWLFEGSCIP